MIILILINKHLKIRRQFIISIDIITDMGDAPAHTVAEDQELNRL